MAEDKKLPRITTKNWWGIRKKLKSTMPKSITKSFVAASMDIQESSAEANVIRPMKQMGLLDENGGPTRLANEWRNDGTYAAACKKIRESTYPQELLDLAPDLDTDKTTVQNWIASHLMVGDEAARQSMTVYMLLLEADPSKQNEASTGSKKTTSSTTKKAAPKKAAVKKKVEKTGNEGSEEEKKRIKTTFDPSMNINIQIHISSDTSVDQIDKIFTSMAKHLKSMAE